MIPYFLIGTPVILSTHYGTLRWSLTLPCIPSSFFPTSPNLASTCPLDLFVVVSSPRPPWACTMVCNSSSSWTQLRSPGPQKCAHLYPDITLNQVPSFPALANPEELSVLGKTPCFLALCLRPCSSHLLDHSWVSSKAHAETTSTMKPSPIHQCWDLSPHRTTAALYFSLSHGTYHILPCIIATCALVLCLFVDCNPAKGRHCFIHLYPSQH